MKTMLLILMVLANVATAQIQQKMTDAEMKALIIGNWRTDFSTTFVYKSDGTVVCNWDAGKDTVVEKWDVKDGVLQQTDDSIGRMTYSTILFLTKREWLMLGTSVHNKGYFFRYRKDEDMD